MGQRKTMKLIDAYTGRMQCKICGHEHCASLKRGGGYHYGSWQCSNIDPYIGKGCRLEKGESVTAQREAYLAAQANVARGNVTSQPEGAKAI